MSLSRSVGAISLLFVLTACGGRSESDLAQGAKNLGLVPDSAGSDCVGRVLANSGLSDETLDLLEDEGNGSSKPRSAAFPQDDNSEYQKAMAKIEADC